MKTKSRIIVLLLMSVLMFTSACLSVSQEDAEPIHAVSRVTDTSVDREGNPISLPENIRRIITMGPSNTEVMVELGFANKIIAIDEYSANIPGLAEELPKFNMLAPDGERFIDLEPDVIFITGMSKAYGSDPMQLVESAGICVIYMPSSDSIEGIKEDIRFMAQIMGVAEKGNEIILDMEKVINEIVNFVESITDRRTVYFEISPAPNLYSFGTGVFLSEMLEIVGLVNVLGDQTSWVAVSDETVLDRNPDVIFTNVNYIEEPVNEIINRPGWGEITAVQNRDVYSISTDWSSRPSHNIILSLREMAEYLYPDKY